MGHALIVGPIVGPREDVGHKAEQLIGLGVSRARDVPDARRVIPSRLGAGDHSRRRAALRPPPTLEQQPSDDSSRSDSCGRGPSMNLALT